MSAMSEETPTNPQDPLHYAPRRTNARPELRLSSVSAAAGETPFDRAGKPEAVRRPPSLSAELENAVFESLRRQMDPEVVPEPPGVEGRLWRRAWLGVGAAVGLAAIGATLFVVFTPHEDAAPPVAAAVPATTTQPDATKPAALAQFRSLIQASGANQASSSGNQASGDNQAANHEQSEGMLKRFMLWRQKVDTGDQAH